MSTLEAAKELAAAGLSVVPVMTDGTKRPAGGWKEYQTLRASTTKLHEWFAQGNQGIGIITGTISGNLEMSEVEGRGADRLPEIAQLATDTGLADLWARLCAGWLEQSPSGGWHWFYKISYPEGFKFPGNTKLAKAANKETLAETRSEGGFVVVAPSAGTVHPSGKPWVRVAGGPSTIPTITPDEREAFHALLGTLNEYTPEVTQQAFSVTTTQRDPLDGTTPGDDFENKTTWADILQPAGWTKLFTSGRTTYWRRPGKTIGMSATTGNAEDRDRLYVFTSSTEFEQETPYTKFGAYALLHHRGNHAAAASELRKKGHGSAPTSEAYVTPRTMNLKPGKLDDHAMQQLRAAAAPTAPVDASIEGNLATVTQLRPSTVVEGTLTDHGNAGLLIARHGHRLRYVPSRGKWLTWDGTRWEWQEDDGASIEASWETIEALDPKDNAERDHKRRSLSRRSIEAAAALARRDSRIRVKATELDSEPRHLNTPAGIVNLTTGALEPHDPSRLHTKTTGTTANPNQPTPLWDQFLHTTFNGDQEMIGYVQRLAGYSAIGEVTHHVLPFLHGPGGNGKSVFLDTLINVLGDYATAAPSGFLMAGRDKHETEIARLHGHRLVVCSEVNQESKFDEAKVKILTGGDELTGRFMHQDFFTFTPTHTLMLMGNHQPKVGAGGDSFWRRLRLIPFTHTVTAENRIDDLTQRLLAEEAPGILHWIIQGAQQAIAAGLQDPVAVTAATDTYAQEEDALGRFVSDMCRQGPGAHYRVETSKLRHEYADWCREQGERELSPQQFGRELRTRFNIEQTKSNGRRYYQGIVLYQLEEEPAVTEDHWASR